MLAVIQRVVQASVSACGDVVCEIQNGLLVLIGVHKDDTIEQSKWLASKIAHLRVFSDKDPKMNLSIKDTKGALLIVLQLTPGD
jgi:D-tyrosyl-tRNA(Tyr) deacylase